MKRQPWPFFLMLILILFLGLTAHTLSAQEILLDLDQNSASNGGSSELTSETIIKISDDRRLLILSNQSELVPGDFITLLINNRPVARALVAKSKNDFVGIKITKLYTPPEFNQLINKQLVQIIRGDDSTFLAKLNQGPNETTAEADGTGKGGATGGLSDDPTTLSAEILSEDQLLNDKKFEDEFSEDEKGKRAIKTDSMISVAYGQFQALDQTGENQYYAHWMGSWGYQVADNLWAEATYGQSTMAAFPNNDLDTQLTNFTLRLKYTVSAPLYSYIQPFIGYQMVRAKSPDAGVAGENTTISEEELQQEQELLDRLEKNSMVFGLTIVKRLVPGWFIRGDLSSTLLAIGFAFEF